MNRDNRLLPSIRDHDYYRHHPPTNGAPRDTHTLPPRHDPPTDDTPPNDNHRRSSAPSDRSDTPTQQQRRPELALRMDSGPFHHHQRQDIDDDINDLKLPLPVNNIPPQHHQGTPTTPIDGKGQKPARVLNRVPRACNACRKQKMRCEGADNPPCRRCRHAGLECLFEKPSREASLTGEAGLERIRSLETSVDDLRNGQREMQSSLKELLGLLRHGSLPPSSSTPTSFTAGMGSPSASVSSGGQASMEGVMPHGGETLPPINHQVNGYAQRGLPIPRPPTRESYMHPSSYGSHSGPYYSPTTSKLPPISTIHNQGSHPHSHPHNTFSHHLPAIDHPGSNSRYGPGPSYRDADHSSRRPMSSRSNKRGGNNSNVTSTNSSSDEADDGEINASGLVAPLEVLRGLADEAVKRASRAEGGDISEPASRPRSPDATGSAGSSGRRKSGRPAKRRKTDHQPTIPQDVVSKGVIPESTARQLFQIFYEGCSTFLPVYDKSVDTFDATHPKSPFSVDAICMVGARVMKGGGQSSEVFKKCLEEVQHITMPTLYHPNLNLEQVQAMVLVSGWSDNGWLVGGHAVRMALQLSLHRAWPKLKKRIKMKKPPPAEPERERELVVSTRVWFTLYLMEHQMSYGTGRPAILTCDETIKDSALFLEHNLAIEDDMRLVSTVELMTLREHCQNLVGPFDKPITEDTFAIVKDFASRFRAWYEHWDKKFAEKYPDREVSFYRQSLEIQYLVAELFHNATVLTNIRSVADVPSIPETQWEIVLRTIAAGVQFMNICLSGKTYRENLQNAVHYTHATAAFVASLLLRCAKLFPSRCNVDKIREDTEELARILSLIPSASRYGKTLQMQMQGKPRQGPSGANQEQVITRRDLPPRDSREQPLTPTSATSVVSPTGSAHPMYEVNPIQGVSPGGTTQIQYHPPLHHPADQGIMQAVSYAHNTHSPVQTITMSHPAYGMPGIENVNLEQLWSAYGENSAPVWLTSDGLGDPTTNTAQFGMETYMIPVQYNGDINGVVGGNWG